MAWNPTHLTPTQLEERRLTGGRLLKAGRLSQAEIARQLGVSRATVCGWAKQVAARGLRALRCRPHSGRPPKLTAQQQRRLTRILKRGARRAGCATERWTLGRVQQVIVREFGVRYHPNYVNRLLRRLDWSLQQPLPRAAERDEDLIRAWLAQDWPRIKKSAAARRRHRVL